MTKEKREIYEMIRDGIKQTLEESTEEFENIENEMEKAMVKTVRKYMWKSHSKFDKLAFEERKNVL